MAIAEFDECIEELDHATKMETLFLLYRATGDTSRLKGAYDLLFLLHKNAPSECKETMLYKVPLHRDITAEWNRLQSAGNQPGS